MQDDLVTDQDLTRTIAQLRASIIGQAIREGRTESDAAAFADQVMATPPRFEVPDFDDL